MVVAIQISPLNSFNCSQHVQFDSILHSTRPNFIYPPPHNPKTFQLSFFVRAILYWSTTKIAYHRGDSLVDRVSYDDIWCTFVGLQLQPLIDQVALQVDGLRVKYYNLVDGLMEYVLTFAKSF